MRSSWPPDLGTRALGVLPTLSAAAAEGAWVAVVYAALRIGLDGAAPALDVWSLTLAAVVGLGVARSARGRRRAAVPVAVALAGLAGWLLAPEVRLALADPTVAIVGLHPSGWLAAVAAWRGSRHDDPAFDDIVTGRLLAWGLPGLAIPWLVGTGSSHAGAFVDAALPATLLFVAAGLIAIGLTRLDALSRATGLDWRRNRAWIALLVGVVGAVVVIGLPVAVASGTSIGAAIGALAGPIRPLAGAATSALAGILPAGAAPAPTPVPGGPSVAPSGPEGVPAVLVDLVAVAIGLVLAGVLIAFRRRTRGVPAVPARDRAPAEERSFHLGAPTFARPRIRVPRLTLRTASPRTATQAYLLRLRELAAEGGAGRGPTETPARHAERLRTLGRTRLGFDLLAADFELERYGGRELTPAETRRALRRRAARPRVTGAERPAP